MLTKAYAHATHVHKDEPWPNIWPTSLSHPHHRSSTPPTLGPITSSLRPTLKHVANTVILVPKPGLTKLDGARSSKPPVRWWLCHPPIRFFSHLGRLDVSIRFPEEQARVENVADGSNNTLRIVGPVANRYVSLADVLTLAAIAAIENWFVSPSLPHLLSSYSTHLLPGGPSIPFRGGRIDVAAPNALGVPQLQEDLATHTATFKWQRFSKMEMIGLLVCGHTFGGVVHLPFPDVVPDLNDTSNTQSVAHFNGTPVGFDNSVFTSSPAFFTSTCTSLFAHMLDRAG
ncbi:heme peroxidase [Mycena albidolilacea]|uniref:Peroxidase n=1 Tax=Mycena albidolilacea TaxID=1033008 RepID=A0AAD7EJ46_9AGAR|nr:heme peroxidase [Mycena albidolilacea]